MVGDALIPWVRVKNVFLLTASALKHQSLFPIVHVGFYVLQIIPNAQRCGVGCDIFGR